MIYKTHKVIVYAQITEYFMEVLHQTYPGTLGSPEVCVHGVPISVGLIGKLRTHMINGTDCPLDGEEVAALQQVFQGEATSPEVWMIQHHLRRFTTLISSPLRCFEGTY
jgi:hypothetical protein